MRFRYFIWDFDGTIYDMYPAVVRSVVAALEQHQILIQPEDVMPYLDQPLETTLIEIAQTHQLDPQGFSDEFLEHYRQNDPLEQPLIAGVEHVLTRIQQNGGNNFIFTHRRSDGLVAILTRHNILDRFTEIANTEKGFARKPAPDGFRYYLDKYNLKGEEVLAIGDRNLDIQAAKAAGATTCLYRSLYSVKVQADYTVDSYAELETLLFGS